MNYKKCRGCYQVGKEKLTELMEHKVEVIRTGKQDGEGYKVGREARKLRK